MATNYVAMDQQPRVTSKNLERPDSDRPLGRAMGGLIEIGGVAIGRAVLPPGWRWSIDLKPIVGTRMCEVHHLQLVLRGTFGVQMDGGEELHFRANDIIDIPPGHDTWVVGDEPVELLDLSGNSPDMGLPVPQARAVLTMLMTDIVDSTRTAARIGDAAWKQRLGAHNRIVRQQLERHQGHEVDTTGDGFLATFGSAGAALRAAIAICQAVAAAGVQIRSGVHTGEVDVLESGDLRGIAVHETARIMAAAPTGSVYTSAVSKALAASSGLTFVSTGTHELKGFEEPVELFLVSQPA